MLSFHWPFNWQGDDRKAVTQKIQPRLFLVDKSASRVFKYEGCGSTQCGSTEYGVFTLNDSEAKRARFFSDMKKG